MPPMAAPEDDLPTARGAAAQAVLLRATLEQARRLLGWLLAREAFPPAEAYDAERIAGLSARSEWDGAALGGVLCSDGAAGYEVDASGAVCWSAGSAAVDDAAGLYVAELGEMLGMSALAGMVEATRAGRAVEARQAGRYVHATPLTDGGALVVVLPETAG